MSSALNITPAPSPSNPPQRPTRRKQPTIAEQFEQFAAKADRLVADLKRQPAHLTAEETKAELAAEVLGYWSLVCDYDSRTDTVRTVYKSTTPDIAAELDATNCKKVACFGSRAMQYGQRFDAQQPEDDALIRFDELLPDHCLNGFERAYDLTTNDPEDAKIVALGLRRTMTLRHRRPGSKTGRAGETETEIGTAYLDGRLLPGSDIPRKTRRNLAIYLRGGNIVRVEPRYFSARTLKKRGISRSTDLIGCDFVVIIDMDLRFSAIHQKKLYKRVNQAACNYVQFVRDDDPLSPITVAYAEDLIWEEIAFAVEQQKHPLDPEPTMQDLIDAHPILHDAAVHLRLADLWIDRLIISLIRVSTFEKLKYPIDFIQSHPE